jgi:DNA-binding CsgD family transcriptional regulator
VEAVARGRVDPDVQVVALGDLGGWTLRESVGWRDLLSTRSAPTTRALCASLPNNRRLCREGLRMVSVFDAESTGSAARDLLANETTGTYLYAYAPVQMKIIDQRQVLLEGNGVGARSALLSLTAPDALRAAWSYWHAVLATAVPVRPLPQGIRFTDRQLCVLALLRDGYTDEHIANLLDLSVRTVRTDVHAATEALGARSRFAAGFAFAHWSNTRYPSGGAGFSAS